MAETSLDRECVDEAVQVSVSTESPAANQSGGALESSAPNSSDVTNATPIISPVERPSVFPGKQGRAQSDNCEEGQSAPGSIAVNERAPDLNLRTFRFATMRLTRLLESVRGLMGRSRTTGVATAEGIPAGVPEGRRQRDGFISATLMNASSRAVSAGSDCTKWSHPNYIFISYFITYYNIT